MDETTTSLTIVLATIVYALWKRSQYASGHNQTHQTSGEVPIYELIAFIGCLSAGVGLMVITAIVIAFNIMLYGTAIFPDVPSLKEVTRVYLPIATLLGTAGFLLKNRETS